MDPLKGIALIGIVFWVLFLGGCEAIQKITGAATMTVGAPGENKNLGNLLAGGSRVLATAGAIAGQTEIVTITSKLPLTMTNSRPVLPIQVRPAGMPNLPKATPAPTTVPDFPSCDVAPVGTACINAPGSSAIIPEPLSGMDSSLAVEVWQQMQETCETSGCEDRSGKPKAEVPTECQNPQGARAIASCALIQRGIIHPKG